VKRLGAILAGGKSSRFGSDKAEALLQDRPLIEHVAGALRHQVDDVILCGRERPDLTHVADRPFADMGPLGGLNAALHYACNNGFDVVLSVGCDVLPIPDMTRILDIETAHYIEGHHVFGLWPVSLAAKLDEHLEQQSNHSMRHWIETAGARPILSPVPHFNINYPADLAQYADSLVVDG